MVLTRSEIDLQVILEWKTCGGFPTLHQGFIELSRVHKPKPGDSTVMHGQRHSKWPHKRPVPCWERIVRSP